MKKLTAILLTVVAAVCALSVNAFAGRMPWMYADKWEGAKVSDSYNGHALVMRAPGTAYFDFHPSDRDKSFFIYLDAGNYEGRGKSTVTLDCFDGDGNTVASFGSITITDDGSYHRYEVGVPAAGTYAAVPEGTKVMRVSMTFTEGKNSPFFHIGADFSSVAATDLSITGWEVLEKDRLVDADTAPWAHWVLVGFVFAVAVIMMIFAKVRKKYRKGK